MESIKKLREMDRGNLVSHGNGDYRPDTRHGQIADEIEREIIEKYMVLPADRNGETLRIGDKVWFPAEPADDPHIVRGYGMTNGKDVDVFINYADDGWCPNTVTVPDILVHRKPDPYKELLKEFSDEYVWGADDDACSDVIAKYADKLRELMEVNA